MLSNDLAALPALSNNKIMNRNVLKYIAVLAMIFDHIAVFLLDNASLGYSICRTLGRLTAPIMCFFIAEGFYYTHSKLRYGIRLVFFAIISQLAYTFANCKTILTLKLIYDWNAIYALFIGFLILICYETIKIKLMKWLAIAALCGISFISDWGVIAALWILFFYIFRNNAVKRNIIYGIIAFVEIAYEYWFMYEKNIPLQYGLWHFGLLLAIPILLTYNGEKGRDSAFNKWNRKCKSVQNILCNIG